MNAKRDRDQLLEEALKHELRATAAPATDACLDAETIAAWTEGGLDSGAMAMAEAHTSACERCQALLATVARTAPVAAVAEPQTARLWRWWLAPLAASATAVTLWMVVPQAPYVAPPNPAVSAPAAESPVPVPPAARQEAQPSAPAAASAPVAQADQFAAGKERANSTPPARVEDERRRDAPAAAVREQKAEAPKLADSVAEGRLASAAPAAAALRKDVSLEEQVTARATPSPNVVWRVGRAGLVQLATDGRTFTRLPFPEAVDLTAVTATDQSHAVVTAADGRTFQTADGGRTWQRP